MDGRWKAREIVGHGFISSTNRLTYAACAPIITSAIRLSRALLKVSTRLPRREKRREKTTAAVGCSRIKRKKNTAASHISVGVYCLRARDERGDEENNNVVIYDNERGRCANCSRSKGEIATKCLIFGIPPGDTHRGSSRE